MDKKQLEEAGIFYPIKLEYYKNEDENSGKFGIEVIKTEYKKEKVETEKEEIPFIMEEEKIVNTVLDTLKEGQVTPVGVRDVVHDLLYK